MYVDILRDSNRKTDSVSLDGDLPKEDNELGFEENLPTYDIITILTLLLV